MLASPSRRLTRDQHLAKFRECCTYAATPMASAKVEGLIEMVDQLEQIDDVRDLAALLAP
jgi:hypothetical protein